MVDPEQEARPLLIPEFSERGALEQYYSEKMGLERASVTVEEAEAEVLAAEAALSDARAARTAQELQKIEARNVAAIAIAEDENLPPVRRAIWATSFAHTNLVADPEVHGAQLEAIIGRIEQKLEANTPILIVGGNGHGIVMAKVETPGLTTDLQIEPAPAYEHSPTGKRIRGGGIMTFAMPRLAVKGAQFGRFKSIEFAESYEPLEVKPTYSGDKDVRTLRALFDEESSYIKIGNEHIENLVYAGPPADDSEAVSEFLAEHGDAQRYWIFFLGKQAGIAFEGFEDTEQFQTWKELTENEVVSVFRDLAMSPTGSGNNMASWPKEQLQALMSIFHIEPAAIQERVRDSFNTTASTRDVAVKVAALSRLEEIFALLQPA